MHAVQMHVGLTIPGRGHVAGPAAASLAAVALARRWFDAGARLTGIASRARQHCPERSQVTYFIALFTCGVLFGLFVGGFVGFMGNATPHAGSPCSLAQLATSDVQWTAMMRQYGSALQRPSESAARSGQETPWQHLTGGAAVPRGVRSIPLDTQGFRAVKKAVVTR